MISAEESLDAFWKTMDSAIQSKSSTSFDKTQVRKLLSQERSVQRTAPWVEPTKIEKNTPDPEELIRPLSEIYFDLERRTERTLDRSARKSVTTKQKTKGTPALAIEDEQCPPGDEPDKQPTFSVDARALKVFRTLFYTPSVSATPGEVPWHDFLHAIASVGFLIEKLYGSVWQFQPTKLDVERGIQLHEPHPSGKMAYRTARRVGRRLERAYGWFGEMFVLAEKVPTNQAS